MIANGALERAARRMPRLTASVVPPFRAGRRSARGRWADIFNYLMKEMI